MRMKCHNKTSGRHQVVKTLIPLKVSVELILSPGRRGLQGYQGYHFISPQTTQRGIFQLGSPSHPPQPFTGNLRSSKGYIGKHRITFIIIIVISKI